MGITKQHLEKQLASFEAQRDQLNRTLASLDGAEQLARALLGKLQREEDEARAAAVASASTCEDD